MKTLEPEKLEACRRNSPRLPTRPRRRPKRKPAELSRVKANSAASAACARHGKFDEAASDLMELAKAVVAGKAPLEYLAFNSVRIGIAVRSEKLRECPGLVIKEERSV